MAKELTKKQFPTYSIDRFNRSEHKNKPFQVEVFDAHRHFEVQYPHSHDFFEILFITKGSGIHVIDQNQYEITPPCVFFLSPGQAHKLELSEDIAGYIFLFTDDFYLLDRTNKNRLLELPFFYHLEQKNPPLQLTEDQFSFLERLFLKGCEQMNAGDSFSYDFVNSILDLILNFCLDIFPSSNTKNDVGRSKILAKQFLQLVEKRYLENLSIDSYADHLKVTPNHLTQVVKQFTGKTSRVIVKNKQITQAKRLLQHSNLTSSEIATQLNFKDQSYFSRFFKKETGLSPKQYRSK